MEAARSESNLDPPPDPFHVLNVPSDFVRQAGHQTASHAARQHAAESGARG
jgi:hypothetical protein